MSLYHVLTLAAQRHNSNCGQQPTAPRRQG